MNRKEVIAVLGKYGSGFPTLKLDEPMFNLWADFFKDVPIGIFTQAIEAAIKEEPSAFFPSVSKVYDKAVKLKTSKALRTDPTYWVCHVTPEEAASGAYDDKLVVIESWGYARTVEPNIPGSRQFSSPEEMQKNVDIKNAQQKRKFVERFEKHQDKIKELVASGYTPRIATLKALDQLPNRYFPPNIASEFRKGQKEIGVQPDNQIEFQELAKNLTKTIG